MRTRLLLVFVGAMVAVILAGCGNVAEPPWEVRTYLSDYTDDAATATQTYTANMSVVRKKWVDPDSGYSTDQEDPTPAIPLSWLSPDPFGAHAGVNVDLVPARSQERIMGQLACTATDEDGDPENPLIGRPFHPGGANPVDWNNATAPWTAPDAADVASYVTVRAAGLASDYYDVAGLPPPPPYLMQAGDKGRFLVVQPGAVRAAAAVAPGSQQFANKDETGTSATPAASAWTIHVNPYRVSNGDQWYIRQSEQTNPGGATTQLRIEVYSKLYGRDFQLNSATDGAVNLGDFTNENGCTIITNSGAVRIECPRVVTAASEQGTWVVAFTIASNTQTLPSPEEMDYDDIGGTDLYPGAGLTEPDFVTNINCALPTKSPWMMLDAGTLDGYLATSDDSRPVVEKATNGNFNHNCCWPYRIPPGAVGEGHVLVEWSDGVAGALARRNDTSDTYYRDDGEWYYHAEVHRGSNSHPDFERVKVKNSDVANGTPICPAGQEEYVKLVDCQFMSTRVDLPRTEDNWVNSNGINKGAVESDNEAASGGYTRVIVGEGADPSVAGSPVGGEYNPGSSTPERPFYVANRDSARTVVCPVKNGGCGTHFLASDHAAGTACPICGVTLVADPGEAEVQYDVVQPPNCVSDGERHNMPPEAVEFGPSNSKVPIGATDFLQDVAVDIPKYQPPSVPAGASPFENDIDNDPAYVGTMLAFHRPAEVVAADVVDTNYDWDIYYQSPNDGYKQPVPGAHSGGGVAELYCPVCDARFSTLHPPAGNVCPFSGATLQPAPGDEVPDSCLMCEEYDLFDLLVSVTRKVELASDQRTVDLGWVAPGVPEDQPNTVSGTMAAGTDPRPADVSERSDFVVRNEGNIATPTQMRAGYLFRPEIDPTLRSWARNGQSVPGTVGTLRRFVPGPGGDVAFPSPWGLATQEATGAAGMPGTARLQAGVRNDPAYVGIVKPVPMGQPAGDYTGEVLVYVDLDGDGQLDFIDSELGPTDTSVTEFNAETDEPYEPVAAFSARMRVVESRLPQDDFYSRDVQPTAVFDDLDGGVAGLDNLQVIWVGNRLSAQGATPGAEAAAGTDPTTDVPSSNDPFNILFTNATAQLFDTAGPTYDPLYRGWLWERDGSGALVEAKALSADSGSGTANGSPTAYVDEDAAANDRWAMWHYRHTTAAGVDSQLRFDSSSNATWSGSGPTEFIYGKDPTRFGLTGYAKEHSGAPGDTAVHWLFWHTGPKGHERIRYRWDFDPNSAVVTSNEANLPVSNGIPAGSRSDVWYDGAGHGYKKPSHSPFTYVKDPSVFQQFVNGAPYVHVFFAGQIRAAGNSDICWVKFNQDQMHDATANYGKAPFPRVTDNEEMPAVAWDAGGNPTAWAGEELGSDGRRQGFWTTHLDWIVSDDSKDDDNGDGVVDNLDDNTNFATAPDPAGYGDPQFYVGVVRDNAGTLVQDLYGLSWTVGTYDRAKGYYMVTPVLTGLHPTAPPTLALPPGHPHPAHLGELLDPRARAEVPAAAYTNPALAEEWPSVRMQIDPAAGTIQWTSGLFNSDNPADPLAVFNTDGANDDSPSAFYDLGGTSRLTVFWRRSYSSTDTPHFGRTDFIHRTWTMALQVGRPPIDGSAPLTLTDITPTPDETVAAANYTVDAQNGIITLSEMSRIGHVIRVDYTDAAGATARSEYHRIIGWSTETPLPINTVVSEGPLRVIPENYQIPDGTGGTGKCDVVRYWLFWSSPRSTYDVRVVGSDGQRAHQSSDVYCAVVAPEYGSLIREVEVPRLGP